MKKKLVIARKTSETENLKDRNRSKRSMAGIGILLDLPYQL